MTTVPLSRQPAYPTEDVMPATAREFLMLGAAPGQARGWIAGTQEETVAHDATLFEKERRRLVRKPQDQRRRMIDLQILLARLEGVTFDEAAALLRTSSKQLTRWLHGVNAVPKNKAADVLVLAEALRLLHQVLDPFATSRWLDVTIPDLNGRTPRSVIEAGHADRVLALARTYVDQSFS